MATHPSDLRIPADDRTDFKGGGKLASVGIVLAVAGIGAAVALGFGGKFTLRPFLFGYLAAYVTALSLAIGCLGFVLLQHLTRAGWSVGVRRIAENIACTMPILAVLGLPIIISIGMGNGYLYRWALPMEGRASKEAIVAAAQNEMELEPVTVKEKEARKDAVWMAPTNPTELTLGPLDLAKRNYGLQWLNPIFVIVRVICYLVLWSGIARWYRKSSIEQDRTGDVSLTEKMQTYAAPWVVVMVLTVTGLAFDLIMSLDSHWYSTLFGVYYIANCFIGSYAIIVITAYLLQKSGYLRGSITIEHYHDLGKYLFGFTFFYGYVAFSQYMLMWYANIPEETEWMVRHGVSTAWPTGYSWVVLIVLFCHILIPFGGLMSRHVKRVPGVLVFWALWQLLFICVDMYWLTMPEMGSDTAGYYGPTVSNVLITVCSIVGLFGAIMAGFAVLARRAALRPTQDPRLADSLVFQNV